MRPLTLVMVGTVGLLLLAILPYAGATATASGAITTCSSNWSCDFVFSSWAGTGWANGTSGGYLYSGSLSLRLPGEATTSTNLTYWTHIQTVSSNYSTGNTTYWTIGTFVGTDWNTGKVVYGTTDSNYTATCHHVYRWCHYTYTTDNGMIIVQFTRAEPTSTTISCSPTTIAVAGKTSCTVTVLNLWNSSNYPTGKIHLSSTGGGSFSTKASCTLSSTGTCTFTWHPADDTCGSSTLSATYGGTTFYYKSGGSTLIGVTGGC
jgi:hypothetical protein